MVMVSTAELIATPPTERREEVMVVEARWKREDREGLLSPARPLAPPRAPARRGAGRGVRGRGDPGAKRGFRRWQRAGTRAYSPAFRPCSGGLGRLSVCHQVDAAVRVVWGGRPWGALFL